MFSLICIQAIEVLKSYMELKICTQFMKQLDIEPVGAKLQILQLSTRPRLNFLLSFQFWNCWRWLGKKFFPVRNRLRSRQRTELIEVERPHSDLWAITGSTNFAPRRRKLLIRFSRSPRVSFFKSTELFPSVLWKSPLICQR